MKLFSCKTNNSLDSIDCLHGLRVISTQWVVLGHVFMCYLMLPIQNRTVHDTVNYLQWATVKIFAISTTIPKIPKRYQQVPKVPKEIEPPKKFAFANFYVFVGDFATAFCT